MKIVNGLLLINLMSGVAVAVEQPNFIVLFADDLGYGDLGCFGHPTIRTRNLDRKASEGMRFTQFYSAAPVCTPSRAALMTGRLPIRSGMCSDKRRVLFPDSAGGLPDSEITIAEALKAKGYATACVGKWHLGHLPQYLPIKHGFDEYFGIPYSNDMKPCPVMRGEEELEEPAVQETLTPRYTDEALQFIRKNKDKPFFLYLPYTFPHTPLFASDRFRGKSLRGLYGDVVEESDWSVGEILKGLRELNLDEKTLVIFTSDNGPWLLRRVEGGSSGLLREGKGTTWEGGMREPTVAWWPGTVPGGTVNRSMASTLDLLPTLLALAGAESPSDREIDGENISEALLRNVDTKRETYFYYRGTQIMAARVGPWKAHFITQGSYGTLPHEAQKHDPPLLFHLDHDPSEQYDVAEKHPEIIAKIREAVEAHKATLDPLPTQLESRING